MGDHAGPIQPRKATTAGGRRSARAGWAPAVWVPASTAATPPSASATPQVTPIHSRFDRMLVLPLFGHGLHPPSRPEGRGQSPAMAGTGAGRPESARTRRSVVGVGAFGAPPGGVAIRPERARRVRPARQEAQDRWDGLGDEHDLAVLRGMILASPADVGDGAEEAIALIDALRGDLQDRGSGAAVT